MDLDIGVNQQLYRVVQRDIYFKKTKVLITDFRKKEAKTLPCLHQWS